MNRKDIKCPVCGSTNLRKVFIQGTGSLEESYYVCRIHFNDKIYFEENIKPQQLIGNWNAGFALDLHTESSIPLGISYNSKYSKIGGYMNEIKYHDNINLIPKLGKILSDFICGKYISLTNNIYPYPMINGMICTPPSKLNRTYQPVFEIAKEIKRNTHIEILDSYFEKIKKTPGTKGIAIEDSRKFLNGAFRIKDKEKFSNKNILIFDDIFGTGTTLAEITKTIKEQSDVKGIYVLAVTKTRTKSGLRDSNS
ncbi:hypothetical protein KKB10_03045 [Patescibacteria group bacterium]|nr:hypothetical protein [Patescibacteria group bacterium]MBU1951851.1 hypothetical protein [Patescibacteria group bacterium]